MKILNSTSRNITGFVNTKPVSELLSTDTLPTRSLLHIIQEQANNKYLSRSMEIGVFEDKIFEAIHNMFKVSYWDTHNHESEEWVNLIRLAANHGKIAPLEPNDSLDTNPQGIESTLLRYFPNKKIAFTKHLNYDFMALKGYIDSTIEDCHSRMDVIGNEVDDIDCMLEPNMMLTSTNGDSIIHESIKNSTNVDDKNVQMKISDGNKISNEWVTPSSGLLVIYGWLDSSESLNSKSLASSYCVIEGNINNQWEIIGVQTVFPAKNISYVGYSIPVRKGLTIRARTGFTVCGKSGQYSNEQDGYDTLSNSTPNGFKCQIFSRSTQFSSSERT